MLKKSKSITLIIEIGNVTMNFNNFGCYEYLQVRKYISIHMSNQEKEINTKHNNHFIGGESNKEIDAKYKKRHGNCDIEKG